MLLVLRPRFGPFLVVIGAKAARRRSRRTQGTPARIAGGWDEYVDAAVDAGREAPRRSTRSELAASFDAAVGLELAETAIAPSSRRDGRRRGRDAFWESVDAERRTLRVSAGSGAGSSRPYR